MPSRARSSMTPSASHAPSASSTPSEKAPHATELRNASVLYGVATAKPSSSTISTGRISDIKWHHCHGIDHFQRDCLSKKSYIATDDGGYVSAGDVEDDFALQSINEDDLDDEFDSLEDSLDSLTDEEKARKLGRAAGRALKGFVDELVDSTEINITIETN